MKRLLILPILLLGVIIAQGQPVFDLGIKAGINNSKVSLNLDDYNESSITKMHFGAFARLGIDKIYVQPEVYFTRKGGEFDLLQVAGEFDYSAVDVPLLLGLRLIDAKVLDVHLMGGPVFGFVTKGDLKGSNDFNEDYFKDHYVGLQYGVGVDVLFLTIDFRMEHGNTVYEAPTFDGKNRTFMVTVGWKIL